MVYLPAVAPARATIAMQDLHGPGPWIGLCALSLGSGWLHSPPEKWIFLGDHEFPWETKSNRQVIIYCFHGGDSDPKKNCILLDGWWEPLKNCAFLWPFH
jgi:hypothetical protein